MSHKQSQHGAALVVGLVMLLVLTLLGISNMSMTTLELRMAANAQNKNHAFQAAAAVIEGIAAAGYTDMQTDPDEVRTLDGYGIDDAALGVDVERGAMYEGSCAGSKAAIYDVRMFRCVHFRVDIDATHVNSGAMSLQTQGLFVVGAKSNNML